MRSQDVILGILMESDASGYDIKQKFEKLFSHFYNASYGTIYPTLNKMEKDGLIAKRTLPQEGRPSKNVYSITEKGRQAFYRYLESDIQEVEIKSDFMVRQYFGQFAKPELVIEWMETEIRKTEQYLSMLYAERERWQSKLSPTQLICFDIGISNNENILKNLKEGLNKLASLSNKSSRESKSNDEKKKPGHGSVPSKPSI